MAINLPHWLAEILGVLGFNWPEIDEDQLRQAGKYLRTYADNCEQSHDRTHSVITNDLAQAYTAQSYTALVQTWSGQSSTHMKELIDVCRVLADGLEVAAVGVEGMKGEVIVQLGIAAAEFAADQAAAVATFGIAEAAEPVFIEIQNRVLNAILQKFEAEVVGKLVTATLGPIEERVERAVQKLMFMEVDKAMTGGPPPLLKADTGAMRTHADNIGKEAEANLQGGRTFRNQAGVLNFTTGG